MTDIVAELDRWLALRPWIGVSDRVVVQNARDEIVALREERAAHLSLLNAARYQARAEALEEAARECEGPTLARLHTSVPTCRACAAAIRALKDKPDDGIRYPDWQGAKR